MPTWNSDQYLRFARERTQPARDLAARIEIPAPARVVDLGCGPGNSTAVLKERWRSARIQGVDTSPEMLVQARKALPEVDWREGDIATWQADGAIDVVFSNAALQWVLDHATLLPRLLGQVAPGGALAFQVPANFDAPAHALMRDLGASATWRRYFSPPPREWHVHPIDFYYDVLCSQAARLELWTTDYLHLMPGPDAIVEWYRGTGLRPWLDALPDDSTRAKFVAEYGTALARAYPRQHDGVVLFPFRRLFVIAYR